jgi:hypothetical protein
MPGLSLRHVLIGIIATFVMDVLTGLSSKLGLIAPLSPHLIGRWFAYAAQGKVLHSEIGQVARSTRTGYRSTCALRDWHHTGPCVFACNVSYRTKST